MSDREAYDTALEIVTNWQSYRNAMGWPWVLDLIAAVLGVMVMSVSLCRLRALTTRYVLHAAVGYASLLTGGFCLAFAPWLFSPYGTRVGSVVFAASVVVYLIVMRIDWRDGKPPAYFKDTHATEGACD
jgi:multisubunit Na+/H+ antiporter MnhB subunit